MSQGAANHPTDGLEEAAHLSSPRRLLAQLRDIMAGSGSPQDRLDRIVQSIAAELGSAVCSCYVARPGELLELYATVGLKKEAIHQTRLRIGEGLVGEIAATALPLAVSNAPDHPRFAHRPETGEDPYLSLAGVPMVRSGAVQGVLVLQNRENRRFSDDEIEILQTIAMVVAELVTSAEIAQAANLTAGATGETLPARVEGKVISGGLAQGHAVLHQPRLTVREVVADDPEREAARLNRAVKLMHRDIDRLFEISASVDGDESADILEAYRMFAQDRGWIARMQESIHAGLSAEAAVKQVQDNNRARMARVKDRYLRERLNDLDDLATRLLMNLAGRRSAADAVTMPDDVVLIAQTIGPAQLLDYERSRLRAMLMEEGSETSHVAVVARALGIPVITGCRGLIDKVEPFDPILVDGENGQIFVRPSADVLESFEATLSAARQKAAAFEELRHAPAITLDGTDISLMINAGLLIDLPRMDEFGASGVGLYRTELPFMVRSAYPDVPAQIVLYRKILDQAGDRPVVFRTLDVGGDKQLPYFKTDHEDNPALGWRAVRIGLDRPVILRHQIRALLGASQGRPLKVMFPMVATVDELLAARAIWDLEWERALSKGRRLPERADIGVMVEVPALLWQLPTLMQHVDFLAIGSNDLMQYMFAADRDNPRTANRYDRLSIANLNILRWIVETAADSEKPVSICGEMAGQPLEALALLGIGFRTLSMSPSSIGPVKRMVRSVSLPDLAGFVCDQMDRGHGSIRPTLLAYAKDHGVFTH
ncbi:MAG: phosphoenolpyruvate--protein phosphotransferase [Pseudomonadota bacterium]